MNFEELYEKYKTGAADEQERAFVAAEIEKARRVSALLEKESSAVEGQILPADREAVRKARKAFNIRTTVRTAVICAICIVVLGALACGAIFGTAIVSAHKQKNLTEEQAIDAAKALLATYDEGSDPVNMIVSEAESELDMKIKLTETIYIYEITLVLNGYEYRVDVSAKTGYAVITDKEAVRDGENAFRPDTKKESAHEQHASSREE